MAGSSVAASLRDVIISVPVHVGSGEADIDFRSATLSEPMQINAGSSSESEMSDTSPLASSVAMPAHKVVVSMPSHAEGAASPIAAEVEHEHGVEGGDSRVSSGRDIVRDADGDLDVDVGDCDVEGERGESAHVNERGEKDRDHPQLGVVTHSLSGEPPYKTRQKMTRIDLH